MFLGYEYLHRVKRERIVTKTYVDRDIRFSLYGYSIISKFSVIKLATAKRSTDYGRNKFFGSV